MAKKTAKAKKIVKHKKPKESIVTIPQPQEVVVESASVNGEVEVAEVPKKKSEPKQKPKQPFRFELFYATEEIFALKTDRVNETYYVEMMEEPQGKGKPKWVLATGETFPSLKKAKEYAKEARDYAVEQYRDDLERDWHSENMHNQQTKQIVQLTITKRTSKKALDEFVKTALEHKERLKENPPVEKPDFSKVEPPEYPKYRVRRRRLLVEDEVVD